MFGIGPEFAAQCPHVAPPEGWRAWTDADGPIPEPLAIRAQAIADDDALPLGSTESFPIPGVVVLLRAEPRHWGHDASGNLVHGCFRFGGIYLPSSTPVTPVVVSPASDSKLAKTIAVLTAASLTVGIAASLAAWRRGKKK
jgi:hypothetical protein